MIALQQVAGILHCTITRPEATVLQEETSKNEHLAMTDPGVGNLGSIFRRGGSKKELFDGEPLPDKQELNQQLQQLAVAWAIPKAKKGLAAAVWRPLIGAFEVFEKGRQHFNGQGFMHNKKLYLNVEEAVFMMDQAELLLLVDRPDGQQQLLSMQEAGHMMVSLGISHDRLQVLSHLCRLGYHVRRHPACWYAPADQPAAATWQVNPAWRHTDGLFPPQQRPQQAAAAYHAGAAAVGDTQLTQEQQQQARKKRKVDEAPPPPAAAAAAAAAETELHEQAGKSCTRWWDRLPYWLRGTGVNAAAALPPSAAAAAAQTSSSASGAGANSAAAGGGDCGGGSGESGGDSNWLVVDADSDQQYQLLGVQLQQRFPNLRPLPIYTGLREPIQQQQQQPTHPQQILQQALEQQQLQQQPQQLEVGPLQPSALAQQQQQQQQQRQRHCQQLQNEGSDSTSSMAAEMVYDAIPCAAQFSYKCPPAPLMSFAMVKEGCTCLPSLAELLQLSAAAADGTGKLTGKQEATSQGPPLAGIQSGTADLATSAAAAGVRKFSSVMVAMPDGSDVNYYELKPISLMNLLTNQA